MWLDYWLGDIASEQQMGSKRPPKTPWAPNILWFHQEYTSGLPLEYTVIAPHISKWFPAKATEFYTVGLLIDFLKKF